MNSVAPEIREQPGATFLLLLSLAATNMSRWIGLAEGTDRLLSGSSSQRSPGSANQDLWSSPRAAFEYRIDLSSLRQHPGELNEISLPSAATILLPRTQTLTKLSSGFWPILLREILLKSADSSATPPPSQIYRARRAVGIKVVIALRDPGSIQSCSEPREFLTSNIGKKIQARTKR